MKIVVPTCENCKHAVPTGPQRIECRRFPPLVNPNFNAPGSFPLVYASWWCSEYQQKKDGEW